MAVYVDSLLRFPGNRIHPGRATCHLFADSEEELHGLAGALGMRREWAQIGRRGILHYDLNAERRERALALGARALSRKASVAKWRELREAESAADRVVSVQA
jgi:hypothetical protein